MAYRHRGSVGGLVGTLGGLGGFLLPLGFGYLESMTGRPESCFWVVGFVTLASLMVLRAATRSTSERARGLQTAEKTARV